MQIAAASMSVLPQFRAAATMFEVAELRLSGSTTVPPNLSMALQHATEGARILTGTKDYEGGAQFADIAQRLVIAPLTSLVQRTMADATFRPMPADVGPISQALVSLARNLSPKG